MTRRRGVSLVETLIVITIIALLAGLLFPAVQAARTRALETQCKNNLHQINLAVADFYEANKRLPGPGSPGVVGGWTIDVLPFLEQQNLRDRVTPGGSIASAPAELLRQPRVFRCPVRSGSNLSPPGTMDEADYVFVPHPGRRTYDLFDAPPTLHIPWASGPEMAYNDVTRQRGPHHDGFFHASGFQNGVGFIVARPD
jgi:prepilin-type N-terminal cleavage/methylation domain-containing protein